MGSHEHKLIIKYKIHSLGLNNKICVYAKLVCYDSYLACYRVVAIYSQVWLKISSSNQLNDFYETWR
jgi:hypothetical protein